jgi:hypothetical protein
MSVYAGYLTIDQERERPRRIEEEANDVNEVKY